MSSLSPWLPPAPHPWPAVALGALPALAATALLALAVASRVRAAVLWAAVLGSRRERQEWAHELTRAAAQERARAETTLGAYLQSCQGRELRVLEVRPAIRDGVGDLLELSDGTVLSCGRLARSAVLDLRDLLRAGHAVHLREGYSGPRWCELTFTGAGVVVSLATTRVQVLADRARHAT